MKQVIKEPKHLRKLRCFEIERDQLDERTWDLTFETSDRNVAGRFHPTDGTALGAVLCVGGAGGGFDGPARGIYSALCAQLQRRSIAGLRLDYRYRNHLEDCVLDTLLGIEFLAGEGIENVVLVGHSFGGAVVITTGAISPHVKAVVPMSTQTYGTNRAPELAPRPLLLIHGTADEILSDRCSQHVYHIANEPKELRLFTGVRHGLDEAREEILELLVHWITEKLSPASAQAAA